MRTPTSSSSPALDDNTRGLLDARRVALLKPHAVVVNVARGPIIEEAALFGALVGCQIGGAILDVWWRYPTLDGPSREPSAFPFDTLDNVIMTPHCSAWTDGLFSRRAAEMADNLDRLVEGRPPAQVHRALGRRPRRCRGTTGVAERKLQAGLS